MRKQGNCFVKEIWKKCHKYNSKQANFEEKDLTHILEGATFSKHYHYFLSPKQ